MDRWVARDLERERELVTHPGAGGWALARTGGVSVATLVLAFVCLFAGGWWQTVGQVLLAACAGGVVTNGLRRRMSYRNGWLDGRAQMVAALEESTRRGIPPQDWLMGEAQRDAHVLGLPPPPTLPPEV